jgi:hypothetical protein
MIQRVQFCYLICSDFCLWPKPFRFIILVSPTKATTFILIKKKNSPSNQLLNVINLTSTIGGYFASFFSFGLFCVVVVCCTVFTLCVTICASNVVWCGGGGVVHSILCDVACTIVWC